MTLKKALPLLAGFGLAAGMSSNVHAVDQLMFDPDGAGGPQNAIMIDIFDWTVGNALSLDATGIASGTSRDIDTVSHGVLGNFSLSGAPITGTGLNTNYEYTYQAGFRESAFAVSDTVVVFGLVDGPTNFFEVYYDATPDSNMLAGTGFDDGELVLSGHVVTASGVFDITAFAIAGGVPEALDQFGVNDYAGQLTIVGIGGASLTVAVDFYDPSFFVDVANGTLTTFFNTTQKLPFEETQPSAAFPAGLLASLGNVNGVDGDDVQFQSDPNQSFVVTPGETPLACRFTGGGHDTDLNWNHVTEEGEMVRNGASGVPEGIDRYSFGGQAGANTALPEQPKGEWTHTQLSGPSGKFTFHGGTSSAPQGTEIDEIRCMDPGWCRQARPAPAKQLDFDGIGTFKNLGNGKNVASFDIPNPTVTAEGNGNKAFDGTFHWFEVNVDDLGEPGSDNTGGADPVLCPPEGFGEKGAQELANCDCPDFYRITIYDGVPAGSVVFNADGSIDTSSMNKTDVIYEAYGYIDGGNLQIHPLTGFDTK